jgi:23S rRNA (guanosine2251-2'-O)-methyltransferase
MKHNKTKAHYLFGKHAVLAALSNPARKIHRVLVTQQTKKELGEFGKVPVSIVESTHFHTILPPGSVHQGIALDTLPLEQMDIDDLLSEDPTRPIVVLDQVTDPHNVGAILRSAATFDAVAVIVTDKHAPQESGVMAKAASGALEIVPLVTVGNLSQAIDKLKKSDYWIAGLTGDAKQTIGEAKLDSKTALVLGAEGDGMRRLTTERCDFLVKLPMSDKMESLNVSNAAAVALYELYRNSHV